MPLADTLGECATGLRNWLKGQAISMLFAGIATGAGLALLDVPLAFTLGRPGRKLKRHHGGAQGRPI